MRSKNSNNVSLFRHHEAEILENVTYRIFPSSPKKECKSDEDRKNSYFYTFKWIDSYQSHRGTRKNSHTHTAQDANMNEGQIFVRDANNFVHFRAILHSCREIISEEKENEFCVCLVEKNCPTNSLLSLNKSDFETEISRWRNETTSFHRARGLANEAALFSEGGFSLVDAWWAERPVGDVSLAPAPRNSLKRFLSNKSKLKV